MTAIPACEAGRVICYSFLWSHEARAGQENGVKDRPCVIVRIKDENNSKITFVLPITHTPPTNPAWAVEIPAKVKSRLGLDSDRSWAICNEVNFFEWPGLDIVPARIGRQEFQPDFGPLPPGLFEKIKTKTVELSRERNIKMVFRPS